MNLPGDHPYAVALRLNEMRVALHQPLLPMPPAPPGFDPAGVHAGGDPAAVLGAEPGAGQVAALRAQVQAMTAANPGAAVDTVGLAQTEAAIRAAAFTVTEAVVPDAASEAAQRLQAGLQDAISRQLRQLGQPAPKPPARGWEPAPPRRGNPIGPTI